MARCVQVEVPGNALACGAGASLVGGEGLDLFTSEVGVNGELRAISHSPLNRRVCYICGFREDQLDLAAVHSVLLVLLEGVRGLQVRIDRTDVDGEEIGILESTNCLKTKEGNRGLTLIGGSGLSLLRRSRQIEDGGELHPDAGGGHALHGIVGAAGRRVGRPVVVGAAVALRAPHAKAHRARTTLRKGFGAGH